MENQSPKTMSNSYLNFLLFIQEFDIDINDFYSISFTKYTIKFQGNFNSELIKILVNKGLKFVCNNYAESTYIFSDTEIQITLT